MLEVWTLNHPQFGLIEAQLGYDQDFQELQASGVATAVDWPEEESKEFHRLEVGDSMRMRAMKRITNPPLRAQIVVNGKLHRRLSEVPSSRVPLALRQADKLHEFATLNAPPGKDKPSLKFQTNPFGEVQLITLRHGDDVVEFDPPAGSRGAAYRHAMDTSKAKRLILPMMAGLGKGGWALFIIVFGGIFSRLLDWLLSFLPDWELPDWQLPELPNITLPVPNPPKIDLPVITWPDWDLPNLPEIPAWLEFLLEYTKVWVPIVIGIVLGVIALRNHKKSEQAKRQWNEADRR